MGEMFASFDKTQLYLNREIVEELKKQMEVFADF